MPDPQVMPPYYTIVKDAMIGVPVPVWLAIMLAESGGNPGAHNDSGEDDSIGLFQLNRAGGQGSGYDPDVLRDPLQNATIARRAIYAAYTDAFNAMATIPLVNLPMADVAINSGHPGWDRKKYPNYADMRGDPRIRRIVGIWEPTEAVRKATGGNDSAMWRAAVIAYNGGATADGSTPLPGIPGQGSLPSMPDVLGVSTLLQSIKDNKAIIALFVLAVCLIALGAAGIVFSGRA